MCAFTVVDLKARHYSRILFPGQMSTHKTCLQTFVTCAGVCGQMSGNQY